MSKSFVLIVSISLILSGCKLSEKSALPPQTKMPSRFNEQTDSTEVNLIDWQQLFREEHLLTYIDEALKNNLDNKIAEQQIRQAQANVRVAKGLLLPSLNLATNIGQRKFGEYTMDGVGNFDTNLSDNVGDDKRIPVHLPDYYLGFQSSWEIDLWGKLRNDRKAAIAQFMASEKGQHLIKTQLVANVARNYFSLLALDQKLAIIRENIKLQQTAVELITVQKAAGRATELAVQQFRAQLFNTEALEALTLQEITRIENEFNLLLGRFPQKIMRGQPIMNQPLLSSFAMGLPSQLLLQRPDVRQAELELAASSFDVAAARAAFLPSLNLNAAWGFQSFRNELLFNTPTSVAYSLLGGLTTPLFQRNQIKAQLNRATATQLASFYNYQKQLINSYQEVSTQVSKLRNFEASYRLKEKEVVALIEGVSTANDLFVAGQASYLEVVTAQKSVLMAELEAIDLKYEQFQASIDLYKALGGGWKPTEGNN